MCTFLQPEHFIFHLFFFTWCRIFVNLLETEFFLIFFIFSRNVIYTCSFTSNSQMSILLSVQICKKQDSRTCEEYDSYLCFKFCLKVIIYILCLKQKNKSLP